MRCSENHEPIDHEEFYCPLCVALEDARAAEDEHGAATDRIIDLESAIEELSLADVLHLQAQTDAAETRAYEAETKYQKLTWTVTATRHLKTMGERLKRIEAAARA